MASKLLIVYVANEYTLLARKAFWAEVNSLPPSNSKLRLTQRVEVLFSQAETSLHQSIQDRLHSYTTFRHQMRRFLAPYAFLVAQCAKIFEINKFILFLENVKGDLIL